MLTYEGTSEMHLLSIGQALTGQRGVPLMMTGMTVELQHLVAGQWLAGGGCAVAQHQPRPARAWSSPKADSATTADLDDAVAAAADAQAAWAATPIHQRGAVLIGSGRRGRAQREHWGLELAAEEGKTKAEGIGEVRRAAQILRYYGNEGDRQAGEIFASPRAGEQILVTRKPVGVVGVITPFNFPIAIPAWKIAPGPGLRQHRGVEAGQHRAAAGDPAGRRRSPTRVCPPVCSTWSSAGPTSATAWSTTTASMPSPSPDPPASDGASRRRPRRAGCRFRPRWAARTPPSSSTTPTSTWRSSR